MPALVISNLERPSAEVSVVAVYDRRNSSRLSGHRPPLRLHAAAAGEVLYPKKPRSLIICDTSGGHHFLPIAVAALQFHQCVGRKDFEIFRMIIGDFDDEIVVHDESE